MSDKYRALKLSEGVVVQAPDMSFRTLVAYPDDASYEAAKGSGGEPGDIYYNTTDDKIRYFQDDKWVFLAGGGGSILVDAFGLGATPLDTGTVIIDGYTITTGDWVVWPEYDSRIYEAIGVGTNITSWEAQSPFDDGAETPVSGESVRIINGTSYGTQLAIYDGSTYTINDKVRHFIGADYWEQSGLYATDLTNNTTGQVFSLTAQQSENLVVDYSLSRGSNKQIGQLLITHSNVVGEVPTVDAGADSGVLGVDFQAEIVGTDLILNYTTTDTGSAAQMKYSIKRWSDAAGGPGTPPSYTPGAGGSVPSSGDPGDIQFGGGDGNNTSNSNLAWNDTDQALELGGLSFSILKQATLFDNQTSQVIFTIPVADARHMIMEYSIARGDDSRVGRKIIFTDSLGSIAESEDFVEPVATGITLDSDVDSGNIRFKYSSTATGTNAILKYSLRYWS